MLAGFASTEAGFGSDRPGDVGETGAAVGGLVNTSRPSPAANAEQVRLKKSQQSVSSVRLCHKKIALQDEMIDLYQE